MPYLARRSTVLFVFPCIYSYAKQEVCSRCIFVLDQHSTLARFMPCFDVSLNLLLQHLNYTHSLTPLAACMWSCGRAFVFSINFTCKLGRWQIAARLGRKVLKMEHFAVIDVVSWMMNLRKWSRFRWEWTTAITAPKTTQNILPAAINSHVSLRTVPKVYIKFIVKRMVWRMTEGTSDINLVQRICVRILRRHSPRRKLIYSFAIDTFIKSGNWC